MQRCASIMSLSDVYQETDEVLEYLKSHNGIVDQPINGNENIIEGAVITAPAVETAPDTRDLRGCIPSANKIATPTVEAVPAPRFRVIQTIQQNDSALKRTHINVPLGHDVQQSKVPKPNPQASLSINSQAAPAPEPFSRMTLHQQNAFMRDHHSCNSPGYRATSYDFEAPMDDSNPYAPLPRQVVKYNVMRDNNSSSDNSSPSNPRWNSSWQVRNKGKGKGKGKSFKKGKREPDAPFWTVPEFGKAMGDSKIVLYSWDEFIQPNNPFRKRTPLHQQRSNLPGYIVQLPEPALVAERKQPDQQYDQDLQKVYHNALKAIYQLADSPRLYLLQDEGQNPITLKGQVIQYLNQQAVHELVPENQKTILGDYWRVLRLRPPTNQFSAGKPHLEYIPNNTYAYNEIKMTLDNVKRFKIKPTRYWNEALVKDVPSDILYSLSDYYPGLPFQADIVRDNEHLHLPKFRIYETVFFQDQEPQVADNVPDEDKPRKRVDVQRTIDSLVGCGALPDAEQVTLESYFIDIEEHLNRYEGYLREWPFLVAQRLLKMQVSRLKNIKHALTEKLNNHPLSTANTAVFGSNPNQGNPPAPADTTSQSGGTKGDNSQSAIRSGPMTGLSGGGI
jgi:hypothetical protein